MGSVHGRWHALRVTEAKIGLVLDCADPKALAGFWSQALGLEFLEEAGSYVALTSSGALPNLLLQRVNEPKAGKNRMHLDIQTTDLEAEVGRLEALGAKRLEDGDFFEHNCRWVVMLDPEGNEFCVCHGGVNAEC